ncbi:MAG: GNAT family N-acetyltransferase [Gemmatimonadetes bacterium]|nr:GNAT family N-acetyltransferase [Gemmatimonadota bacterium]
MTDLVFETPSLQCRRWVTTDLDAIHAVYSDREAMRWVDDGEPITRAACEEWLRVTERNYATRGYGMFALTDRERGEVVGFCGLVHPGNQPEPEIKYAFRREVWGRGLASEAVPALLRHGASLGMERIIATVAPENVASRRVLEKAGLREIDRREDAEGTTLVYEWIAPAGRA